MSFASFMYILVFLPVTVTICIAVRKLIAPAAAQFWIFSASIVFYARSNPFNLTYLFASILGNWLLARAIERAPEERKKPILIAALAANICYLGAFKYVGFFASIFAFALPHGFKAPLMPFPLGISFFTITQIMFLVDCYEGVLPAGSLFDHATFASFFPYVISGPLARSKRMRHQFGHFGGQDGERTANLSRGVYQFSIGLFKKVVLADSFYRVSDYGYTAAPHTSALEAWVFSVAYALQIYFDFSGYSDMAIGSARMLGIDIPRNFDAPYKAKSIIEFWERWHISLTGFITTYLYTPIVRSFRKATLFTSAIATFLAMGISGLWHGPAWTFVIWGFLHGAYLGVNQYWRKKRMPRIPPFLSWMLTFSLVVIAEVYFGASSVGQANVRVASLFNPRHALDMSNLIAMKHEGVSMQIFSLPLLIGSVVAFFGPSSEQSARDFYPNVRNCGYAVVLTLVSFLFVNSNIPSPFVYFRF